VCDSACLLLVQFGEHLESFWTSRSVLKFDINWDWPCVSKLHAISRSESGHKLSIVRVSSLVEISVLSPLNVKFLYQVVNCCTWLARTVLVEWSIWVNSIKVPSLDAFISPRINTRANQNIEFLGVFHRFCLQEKESSLNSTSLIPVNSSGHQDIWLFLVPAFSFDTHQWVSFWVNGQCPILFDIEVVCQLRNLFKHFVFVRPFHGSLSTKPSFEISFVPLLAFTSDWVENGVFYCVLHLLWNIR